MKPPNHYTILQIHCHAPQGEIKKAYRKLVKQFHPDLNHESSNHDTIVLINAAYETLSNPHARASYDQSIGINSPIRNTQRADFNTEQTRYRSSQKTEDDKLNEWMQRVYEPISQMLDQILGELQQQIDNLADDPFDDQLMSCFLIYLDNCRHQHSQAQQCFRRFPNPIATASVAEYIYHCLNQLGDGIEELQYFTTNFDDRHLHTGLELWRIAEEMYESAQAELCC